MTPAINAALRERYPLPQYALFFEVANGTGVTNYRYVDALAMGLFPSRGLELYGFEVKASRGDWQRELKNPRKAEAIAQFCDRWWVCAPQDVVKKEELPPTWGLLELRGAQLRQIVGAPRLHEKRPELPRSFIAAILRRACEADTSTIQELVRKRSEDAEARREEEIERLVAYRLRDAEEKLARVREVEEASGLKLTDWGVDKRLGLIVRAVKEAGLLPGGYDRGLRAIVESAEQFAKRMRPFLDELEIAAQEALPPEAPKALNRVRVSRV